MDLALTDDQQFFQETTRKFLEQQCPITTVRAWAELPAGFEVEWWRQAAELGFTSFLVSESNGGGSLSGKGLLDLVIVAEEMGRLVSPGPLVPTNVVAAAVSDGGTSEQRARVLPGLLAGDAIAAWCSPTSHVAMERDVDAFVLRGTVAPVEAGAEADELLVTASAGDGRTQFLVPANTAGVTITPLDGIDLVRRFARIDFDDVRLDETSLLGEVGRATSAVDRQVLIATVLQCSETVGAMDRVFEFTVEYLGDRYSFGRPLASYQALKHRVADMKLWLESSHGVTTLAAHAVQDATDDAAEIVHAAKAYVGDHSTELVQQAVQLHGGIGVTWEHDLHLYLRRVTTNRNLLGAPAEHREQLAAISLERLEERKT
jgi:alkylation response protein AidB-like acyl-CoA dehydrogenase